MRRIKLTVAYDGTNYCGWQIQPNGITIEEVLNQQLSRLTGEEIHVIGASRTDSGVHSRLKMIRCCVNQSDQFWLPFCRSTMWV